MTHELLHLEVCIMLLISYLVGSIPFGLIIAKFVGVKDIRMHGSGNIGATNVLRVVGKSLGLFTLILDMLKGIVIVITAKTFFDNDLIVKLSMVFVVLGHIFPIWLKGKGGKGVATGIAALMSYNYLIGSVASIFWVMTFIITRISSLSSIITFITLPVAVLLIFRDYELFFTVLFLSCIIIAKHYHNVIRLLHGKEHKINSKTRL